jgi:CRP-like cAMP-binding protein
LLPQTRANQYTGNLAWTQGFPGGNWSYASADVRTQYTASLYWTLTTMTTVGYGDIVPLSNYERAFACVVELLGAVCTALVFGNVALLVQGLDGAGAAARERLAVLNEFAARHGLPAPLAARLRASAAHAAAAHGGVDAAAATAELPPSLRAEVLTHLQAGAVRSAPLLRGCAPGLVDACVRSACLRLYLPGERVFEAGDPGRDIFFIARGAVKLTSPDGEAVYALLKVSATPAESLIEQLLTPPIAQAGEHFGEVEALGASARRGATAVAIAACELHALSRDALDAALCDYPEHCEQLRAAAAERAVALDAARVKCGVLDSDTPPGKEQGIITTADEIAPPAPPAELAAPGAGALAEAEAALDALLTWQSAQATALHRKLCGAPSHLLRLLRIGLTLPRCSAGGGAGWRGAQGGGAGCGAGEAAAAQQ